MMLVLVEVKVMGWLRVRPAASRTVATSLAVVPTIMGVGTPAR
jgi:hypothetical protein